MQGRNRFLEKSPGGIYLTNAPQSDGIPVEESRAPVYPQLFPTRCNNGGDT